MFVYKALLAAAGVFIATSVCAAVYKTIDANGNVVYTDEPVGDAKPVDLPPLSTIPPPRPVQPASTGSAEEASTKNYEEFGVVTPQQDATLRDNTGNVPVSIALKPSLNVAAGHRIQFYMDGQTQGEPVTSLKTLFENVDRGAHTVAAAVIDASGNELMRTDSVRFYLHRQSVNFPRGP